MTTYDLICEQCGAAFVGRHRDRRFCSKLCSRYARGEIAGTGRSRESILEMQKLGAAAAAAKLRGTGQGKAYPKINGRHAHRVVAEQMLGRPLRPGEVVHHIDENRLNYHPSNLMVLPIKRLTQRCTKGRKVMTLEFRENPKEETRKYANVLLFGPAKTGKSTGAASAPGFIGFLNTEQPNSTEYAHALDTDGRIKELVVPKDPKPLLSEVMRSCYPTTGEGFDTWVLDSVAELHRRLLVSRSRGAVRPTLDAYGDVAREVEDFCRFMVEAPCNFIVVAQEFAVKDEVTGSFRTLPATGTSNPALAQKLLGMVDIIGYTGAIQVTDEEDKRKVLYVSQIVPTEGRPVGVRGRFNALITPEGYRETNLTEWFQTAGAPLAEPEPEIPEPPEPKTNDTTQDEGGSMTENSTADMTNPFDSVEPWEPYLDRYIREEGNYVLTITSAEGGTTSNDNPQIEVKLEGPAGSIRDWVIYHSGQLSKVVGIFTAAGVKMPQPGEFDPADNSRLTDGCIGRLIGRKVGTVVRKEDSYKDPNKTVLRVQGYVPPGRITDDAPADTRGGLPSGTGSVSRPGEPDLPF